MAPLSRSVYVDRLRRAFLLRCHPDRFRKHGAEMQKQQSVLLQALGERMTQSDFRDYASNQTGISTEKTLRYPTNNNNNNNTVLKYALEKRDGSLLTQRIDLSAPPETILRSLAASLESSGAAKLPPPPPSRNASRGNDANSWIHATQQQAQAQAATNHSHNAQEAAFDPHRFNVRSNRGRDLFRFLASVDPHEIRERKAHRMDAIAATLVARRLYSFQSIDGIRLGWSSREFTKLVTTLIQLHEEYSHTFLESLYPLRLVFAHDHIHRKHPLDLYGGVLYLDPSATQLEWLRSIREVTEDKLRELAANRRLTTEMVALLQEGLGGIKVQKGFTCSSQEYFSFLQVASEPYRSEKHINHAPETCSRLPVLSSTSVGIHHHGLRLVVESPRACRRASVTKEGHLQVPASFSHPDILRAIDRLATRAGERRRTDRTTREQCSATVGRVQEAFGMASVKRSNPRVSSPDFLAALARLLASKPSPHQARQLAGASLRVTASGQFCHLADDGSLVVPHDWQ